MDQEGRRPWTFGEAGGNGQPRYELRIGNRLIGHVASKGDADMICRARQNALREMTRASNAARQRRNDILRLEEDIRLLMGTLRKVSDCLRQLRPREVLTAREAARRTLKAMQARGHTE